MTAVVDETLGGDRFGRYAFALDERSDAAARELHASALIVDLMFHGPCGYRSFTRAMVQEIADHLEQSGDRLATWEFGVRLPERMALDGRFPELRDCWDASGITAGSRDLSWHSPESGVATFAHAQALYDGLPWLGKALQAADIRAAHERGTHATFLSTQDAGRFGGRPDLVRLAHDVGLRMVQLTYNGRNQYGCGCTVPADEGLTGDGRDLVALLNDLRVIVDVSHCGPQTSRDACAASDAPVVASHTTARAVYDHDRGKSDRELEAVAGTGGVIGICALPAFLGVAGEATIDDLLDHIDHVVAVVGVEHVALGLDWPLQLPKWALRNVTQPAAEGGLGFRAEHGLDDTRNLVGFDDYRDAPNITRGLVARGYEDGQIRAILGENALRVFEAVVG